MLHDFLILLYAGAVGFVASGITASFYKMITLEPARFGLLGNSVFAWFTTFVLCALTGPVIVVQSAVQAARKDGLSGAWLLAGLGIAAIWSCCSGVVVLGAALALRNSLA